MLSALAVYSMGAQVKEAALRQRYSMAADGAFLVGGGADQVLQFFDALVPLKERGGRKLDLLECAGGCERSATYRKVSLIIGVAANQTSDPAATIAFSRSECKGAVADAHKPVMKIVIKSR